MRSIDVQIPEHEPSRAESCGQRFERRATVVGINVDALSVGRPKAEPDHQLGRRNQESVAEVVLDNMPSSPLPPSLSLSLSLSLADALLTLDA